WRATMRGLAGTYGLRAGAQLRPPLGRVTKSLQAGEPVRPLSERPAPRGPRPATFGRTGGAATFGLAVRYRLCPCRTFPSQLLPTRVSDLRARGAVARTN